MKRDCESLVRVSRERERGIFLRIQLEEGRGTKGKTVLHNFLIRTRV